LSEIIKKVLKGGKDDDDDDIDGINTPIDLNPDVRNISPDMLVYSSDLVPNAPSAPPAPPAPPIPRTEQGVPTEQGRPSFLGDIEKGRKLKATKTIVKNAFKDALGKPTDEVTETESNTIATSSKTTLDQPLVKKPSLAEALSSRLDKIKKAARDFDNIQEKDDT
jgi:hypothetical protein